jgi:hypothetical protein
MDMEQKNESESVEQKQMEDIMPAGEDKPEGSKAAEKESKGQSAEPDIQAFMYFPLSFC